MGHSNRDILRSGLQFCALFMTIFLIANTIFLKFRPITAKSETSTQLPQKPKIKEEVTLSDDTKIEYFLSLAFKENNQIYKWDHSPVAITYSEKVNGKWNWYISGGKMVDCIKRVFDDVNFISKKIKLTSTSDENLDSSILGVPREEIMCSNTTAIGCATKNIQVRIDNKTLDEAAQCRVARHEIMHTLGFPGHSTEDPESVLYQGHSDFDKFSKLDKMLINMMYNTKLKNGMTKDEVRKALEESKESL